MTSEPPQDEVDRIVAAWQRERPDLDSAPLHVFSRLTRLARHLDRARREALTTHGLEGWEFDVLSALRRAGKPFELTPGKLVTETLVTSGTMTNRVHRMVQHGLVERSPDPVDRRIVKVRLTADGLARVDQTMTDLLASEKRVISALGPDERDGLTSVLRTLLLSFEPTQATSSSTP